MRELDRSRPFAEVWGNGQEGYEQDGLAFDMQGRLIGEEPAAAPVPKPAARKQASPSAKSVPSDPANGFAAKSDDELRTLVEIAGETWTDRAAAIALLAP